MTTNKPRDRFKDFADWSRSEEDKRTAELIRRKDYPEKYAKWSPELFIEFDNDPDAAERAVIIWQFEAYSRLGGSEPVVTARYFTGLTETLTNYADHLRLPMPALSAYLRATTVFDNGMTMCRLEILPTDGMDAFDVADSDCRRLLARIRTRRFELESTRSEAASSPQADPAFPDSQVMLRPGEELVLRDLVPELNTSEMQIVRMVKKMDFERDNGGDPNSTGEGIARALERNCNSSFRQILANLRKRLVLVALPNRGYTLGPLSQSCCPDKEA